MKQHIKRFFKKLKDEIENEKLFSQIPIIVCLIVTALYVLSPAYARDLESAASSLSTRTSKLGLLLAPLGFSLAAIFMIFGHQKGATLLSLSIVAVIALAGGNSAVHWLSSIVG